jgi:hypothetical protein
MKEFFKNQDLLLLFLAAFNPIFFGWLGRTYQIDVIFQVLMSLGLYVIIICYRHYFLRKQFP